MYRHVVREDGWAASTVGQLLNESDTSQEALTGLATAAAHAFSEPQAPSKAGFVLRSILQRATEKTASAALEVFSLLPRLDLDSEILALLNTLLMNHSAMVADPLARLIELSPHLIPSQSALAADLADAILDKHSQTLLDMRTAFAASAREFINLAFMLHRNEGIGWERGLTLFERLLALRVDGLRQSLQIVDGRPIPISGAPLRSRRRARRNPRLRRQ